MTIERDSELEKHTITESARSWLLHVMGLRVATVRVVGYSIIDGQECAIVQHGSRRWRMGLGCLDPGAGVNCGGRDSQVF